MSYLEFDPAPCNEACVQAGSEHYGERARAEARIYVRQLKRMFPIPPELESRVSYQLQMNQHDSDAGCYLEIRLLYSGSPAAIEYAMHVEDNLPEHWDETAQAEVAALKEQWAQEGLIPLVPQIVQQAPQV